MALCSQRPCTGVGPGGGPTSCLFLSKAGMVGPGGHWGLLSGFQPPGFLSAPRPRDGSVKLPAELAQAPRLAAVHSLCREIVLLGTLSLWKNTSSDCKLSLTRAVCSWKLYG